MTEARMHFLLRSFDDTLQAAGNAIASASAVADNGLMLSPLMLTRADAPGFFSLILTQQFHGRRHEGRAGHILSSHWATEKACKNGQADFTPRYIRH